MGLDYVELVLAIEESFQIHIADEEACSISTVGDLHRLILTKLEVQPSATCLTSVAFYRTRKAIMNGLGLPRDRLKPSMALQEILPLQDRRVRWRRIQDATGLLIPDLQQPAWVLVGFLLSALALSAIPVVKGTLSFGWMLPIWILTSAILLRFRGFAVDFPNRSITIGDLARNVLARNYGQLLAEKGGGSEQDSWESLCRILIEQTGVSRAQITPQAQIVRDLGID